MAYKIKVGIIGCGAITEEMHLPCALSLERVDLVALVDPAMDRCTALAKKHGIPIAEPDLAALGGKVDAVIIATPPHTHLTLAEAAFAQGLHVLCEKPLANSVAECEKLISAAQSAGACLAVGHMFRFYPVRKMLPDLLRRHELGPAVRVVATEGKPYSWATVTGYTVRREMVPGGGLINAGVHTLDSLIWWFGDPADFLYEDDSAGGLESNVRLWLEFPGGVSGYFRQSRTCRLPYAISVETVQGALSFDTNSIGEYRVKKNGIETSHNCQEGTVDHRDCWRSQLADFVEAILEGRQPQVDGKEGTRVIRLVEKCYASKKARPLPTTAPIPGMTW